MVKRDKIPQVVREPGYLFNGMSLLEAIDHNASNALAEVGEDYEDFLRNRFPRRIFRKPGENAWNPEQIEADRAAAELREP